MQTTFDYTSYSGRVIFGKGSLARTAEVLTELRCSRALVLSTQGQINKAERLCDDLGKACIGIFSNATMHTPVDVTESAMSVVNDLKADCTIAIGGGSTVGLGKAIALRSDLPQIAIPTTYAGSEVTPILGQTVDGKKTTLKSTAVLPEVVIYDPDLSRALPLDISVASGINAIAHAVEALYAQDRNPVSSMMAAEGAKALIDTLPVILKDPENTEARQQALYGAWLCGTVLGTVGMAFHHKLCHTLGGTFNLPHAETHSVILPHAVAFNAVEVPELLSPIAVALDAERPGLGLHKLAQELGAPTSLKELGMPEEGIDIAAKAAVANPYWNPRPLDEKLIREVIENAYFGRPPTN